MVNTTLFQKPTSFLLVSALGLTPLAQAQSVALSHVQFSQDDSVREDPTNAISFELALPAAFPRPASTAFVKLECNDNGMRVTGEGLEAFTATQQVILTETALGFGAFKATCISGKLSVSHPQLLSWLVPHIDDLSDLGDATQYGRDAKGFAITANQLNFAVAVGSVESTTFQRVGQTLKVVANGSRVAVSVTQGSAGVQPLALGSQLLKPVRFNAQQPFTIHLSSDDGRIWQNITVNLAQPGLTFWTSAQPEGAVKRPAGS